MPFKLCVIVMLGLPAVAAAQPADPTASGSIPPPSIGLPLPQIGLPLPEIGLPLPPMGLPAPQAAAPTRGRGVDPSSRGRRGRYPAAVYVVPAFGWPLYEAPAASTTAVPPPRSSTSVAAERLTGRLRLDVERTGTRLQLYVDGEYTGTFEDFSGELELEAGLHAIDIHAPGYETLHVDVNISAGQSIAYRGTLQATQPAAPPDTPANPAAPMSGTPMTVYIIPGCYIGNVPPEDARLPESCDASRVITRQQ